MNKKESKIPAQVVDPVTIEEARSYEEQCLRVLRGAGFRITMPRVQVIRALADTTRALSAYQIHEKILYSGGKIDVVSVYRILSTLQDIGLIHHIGVVDGYYPSRLQSKNGKRSEVVVDERTGDVKELVVPESVFDAIHEQARREGFEVASIKIELTGLIRRA
jgi:Fe2+ or Zn2+ uptake regulation protein